MKEIKKDGKKEKGGCLLELVFGVLDGKECIRLAKILEDIERVFFRKRTYFLALQVTVLSGQEKVGELLEILRHVV